MNSLLYIGRRKNKSQVMLLLGLWSKTPKEALPASTQPRGRVVVSELPFAGALCVPNYLSSMLPLDRPFEKLLENMGKDTVKFFNKQRSRYQVQPITSAQDIAHADQTMMRPFASYRYGDWAQQFELARLQQFAQTPGGLNYVVLDGAKVSCYVGSEMGRGGKRIWRGERGGYIEPVYTQSKLFNDVNRMTYFLEIEQAFQQGYDFYEYGVSLARPEDGVMQWKRKLRGQLDTMGNYNYFYVAPPKHLVSAFFGNARYSPWSGARWICMWANQPMCQTKPLPAAAARWVLVACARWYCTAKSHPRRKPWQRLPACLRRLRTSRP